MIIVAKKYVKGQVITWEIIGMRITVMTVESEWYKMESRHRREKSDFNKYANDRMAKFLEKVNGGEI